MKIRTKHLPIDPDAVIRDEQTYGNAYIEIERRPFLAGYIKVHAAIGWGVLTFVMGARFIIEGDPTAGAAMMFGIVGTICCFILK